jgi:CHASE2 domain-containing sensor protein
MKFKTKCAVLGVSVGAGIACAFVSLGAKIVIMCLVGLFCAAASYASFIAYHIFQMGKYEPDAKPDDNK